MLDNDIFTALGAAGALAANRFQIGLAGANAQDRILYDAGGGTLYYDPTGGGAADRVRIAQLTAGLALTADDFRVID